MSDLWRETMVAGFRDTVMQIVLVLPRLLALFTFIVLGLLAAWLVKMLTVRVLRAFRFDVFCERLGMSQPLSQAGIKQPVSLVVSRVLFWIVFLLFTFMGVDAVNLPATAHLISQIVGFLPNVLAASLVLLIGVLGANFFAEAALIASVNAQVQEARIVAGLVRWGISCSPLRWCSRSWGSRRRSSSPHSRFRSAASYSRSLSPWAWAPGT